jgi:hypothetical protein
MDAICCFIPDEHQGKLEGLSHDEVAAIACQSPAAWVATYGAAPDDYTHGCSDHIGLLVPDGPDTVTLSRL